MKVNRTYTMELRTLELLARKKNKSLIVNLAVRQYMNHEDSFQLANVETKKLLLVLNQRDDIPKHLKLLINSHLFE
jgi:hypothetical protein